MSERERGNPPERLGPRPLALHLSCALATWLSWPAALPLARSGSLAWRPELAREAEGLAPSLARAAPEALALALAAEVRGRLDELLKGIAAYHAHPYRRRLKDQPVLWREGSSSLFDYGGAGAQRRRAIPVLVVPSLINRGYVLDLSHRRSLLRTLAARGFRPLLLEWGAPGAVERGFGLSDYIAGRLERALDAALEAAGAPVAVLGYCMGGLIALALALRRVSEMRALALLATPWDFHADGGAQARRIALLAGPLEAVLQGLGELPVDLIQALFAGLDPLQVARKFRAFARLKGQGEAAEDFVALEDWLNDGIPLAAPVARECLMGWYGENTPARGLWRVAGAPVRPEELALPALVVVPLSDRIVPPASAEALAAALPRTRRLAVPLGHVGMVASAKAPALLWEPLARWLASSGESARPRRRPRA